MDYEKGIIASVYHYKKKLGIVGRIDTIKFKSLGTGENNLNILVSVNKKYDMVYRIGLRKPYERNMKREFDSIKLLPKDIGPKPILLDMSKKILLGIYSVQSYIPGRHLTRLNKKQLIMHARKIALLHKRKYPYWGNVVKKYNPKKHPWSLYQTLLQEYKEWEDNPKILNDKTFKEYYPKIRAYIRKNDYLFKNLRKFSLINHDLCLTNIIFSKDNLYYIDWEWAAYGDYALDLVLLFNPYYDVLPWKMRMNKKQQELFINEYLRYNPDIMLKKRVEVLSIYYIFLDYMFFLWKKHSDRIKTTINPKVYEKDFILMRKSLKKTKLVS